MAGNRFQTTSDSPQTADNSSQESPAQSNFIKIGQRQHVHHSYIWLGSAKAVLIFAVVAFASSYSSISSLATAIITYADSDDLPLIALIIAALVFLVVLVFGIAVLIRWLSYRHFWFEIGSEELSVYSGILNKRRVHVPYTRIQSVDMKAPLVLRVLGLCDVTVDTAGGSANKSINIPYLTNQQAETLRAELYARRVYAQAAETGHSTIPPSTSETAQPSPLSATQPALTQPTPPQPGTAVSVATPAPAAATASALHAAPEGNVLDIGDQAWQDFGGVFAGQTPIPAHDPVSYEYGLTNKQLALAGISNSSSFWVIIVTILGFIATIASIASEALPDTLDQFGDALGSTILGSSSTAGDSGYLVAALAIMIAIFFVGICLIIWVLSAIASCLQFGGFHARRRGNRIEVEQGLLQHLTYNISIDRVQSVIVKQSFIRKLIGYCEIRLARIDAIDTHDNSNSARAQQREGIVIHPFVKLSEVDAILHGIIPEYAELPTESKPLAKRALRRGLIRNCIVQGGAFWTAVFIALLFAGLSTLVPFIEPEDLELVFFFEQIAMVLFVLCAAGIIIEAINTLLWYRGSSFATNKRFMTLTNSGFSRTTVSFPRNKIQYGLTRTNPLQAHAQTTTIVAQTAAGFGGSRNALIDVTKQDGDAWLSWLEPRLQ